MFFRLIAGKVIFFTRGGEGKPNNCNYFFKNKQTFGAKVVSREGNSPDCRIKLLIIFNSKTTAWLGVRGRFGSSHPFKKA